MLATPYTSWRMDNLKKLSGPGTYVEEAQPVEAGTPCPTVMVELG